MNFYRKEASEILGRPLKEAPHLQIINMKDVDMRALGEYIGQKIYEEGPYVVLGRVMQWGYSLDKEPRYSA